MFKQQANNMLLPSPPVGSHPAVERRGRTALTALLCAAGSHSGAEHNVGQLWAEEGNVHGRVAVLVLHVDVRPLGHQKLHQLGVTLCHCQLQWRLVAVVADVDVAASLWKRWYGIKDIEIPC